MSDTPTPTVRAAVVGMTDVGRAGHAERVELKLDGALLLVVCDGMGGAAAGEIASRMAADRMAKDLGAADFATGTPDQIASVMDHAVQQANVDIHDAAIANPSQKGMGTTMTAAVVTPGRLFVSQVGDSRAYLLRKGLLNQITKDQSLIGQLIEEGTLTEEEAEKLGGRNIVLQAVGVEENLRVDTKYWPVLRGDVLVVCSDGLSGMVKDARMRAILTECGEDVVKAAQTLITEANANGGRDNVTVIVARFDGDGLRAPMESAGDAAMEKAGVAFKAPPPPDVPNPMKRMGFVGLAVLAVIAALFFALRKTTADVQIATSPPGLAVHVKLVAPDGTSREADSKDGLVVIKGVRPADGAFELTASAVGYENDQKSVEIKKPVQVELQASPVPKPGAVAITSKTARTRVRIDAPGAHQKVSPYDQSSVLPEVSQRREFTNIPAGTVTVTATRSGFKDWTESRTLPPGGAHEFTVPELEQVKAAVTVTCAQSGAKVDIVDEYGESLGKDEIRDGSAKLTVRVGRQSVRVTKHGFKDFEAYVEVVQGEGAQLDVQLAVTRLQVTLLGPPSAEFEIFRARNDGPPAKVFDGSAAGRSKPLLLEPGNYVIEWRVGNEVQESQPLEVRVGDKPIELQLVQKKK